MCPSGSMPGRDRGSVRAQPPVLDQEHLVAVDGDGLALRDDQGQRPATAAPAVAEQPEIAQQGAGVTQWNHEGFPCAPGASGGRAASGSAARTPSIPCQFSTVGTGRSFRSVISSSSPRLKRKPASGARALKRPYRGFRLSRTQGDAPALACSVRDWRPWAAARSRQRRRQGPQRPVRPSARGGPAGKFDLPWLDADHFPLDMSSCVQVPPGRLANGHFFAANRWAHVISPPPAASRPDMMLSAGVAELVDALDLGSSDESCGGSSPSARTKR